MPANFSIKNVPDHVVQGLCGRTEPHRRSPQEQLFTIVDMAVQDSDPAIPAAILAEVRRLGVSTPGEATTLIRANRDGLRTSRARACSISGAHCA